MNKAPWTQEHVDNLNELQNDNMFHGYTCCGFNGCKKEINGGKLIATKEGWICPCKKYTQDWSH